MMFATAIMLIAIALAGSILAYLIYIIITDRPTHTPHEEFVLTYHKIQNERKNSILP